MRAAFAQGARSKEAGDLKQAERYFREALRYAPANSQLREEVREELEYRLPLSRVQRLVFTGHRAGAERALRELLERYRDHPTRHAELQRILANLQVLDQSAAKKAGPSTDGRYVLRQVDAALKAFRQRHDRYPSGYRELNELLPADRVPLDHFDIIHYSSAGGGFTLVLRSKTDRSNTLTLQKTGLLR